MKKKLQNNKGFTLIEMIISVTISVLLLGSISVFMGNGLKNITFQKNIIESFIENSSIYLNVDKKVSGSSNYIVSSSSGFILKINRKYDLGGFSYIGEKTFNKKYCQSGSLNTNHLIIKTFVPFENIGANFLAGTSYNSGGIKTEFFKAKVTGEDNGKYLGPTDYIKNGTNVYISDTLDHTIKKNGTVIIGKSGIFGNYFEQGIEKEKVLLNNPTGLAFGEGKLFFSDSLNDRILYLNGDKIYSLLDEKDGLNEPTGLFYSDTRKSLFIANSGNGNILEFSSSGITNPELVFTGANNVDKIEIEFLNSSGTGGFIDLTGPSSTRKFVFNGQGEDFLSSTGSKLTYFLEEYKKNSESIQNDCNNSGEYIINSSSEKVKCTQTGTGIVGTSYYQNLSSVKINVSDILPDFSEGNYFVKIDMGGNTKYFPYFTKSDNDITTKNDNILREIQTGLNYPTGIKLVGNDLFINSFLDRKQYKININTLVKTDNGYIGTGDFSNFKNLVYNINSDYVSDFPIKGIDFSYSSPLLSIVFKFYKKYSCLDSSENIIYDEVFKKKIK